MNTPNNSDFAQYLKNFIEPQYTKAPKSFKIEMRPVDPPLPFSYPMHISKPITASDTVRVTTSLPRPVCFITSAGDHSDTIPEVSRILYKEAAELKRVALYHELKYYIMNKTNYLKYVSEPQRGMGKTCTLVKLANDFNLPIIIQSSHGIGYIVSKCQELKMQVPKYIFGSNEPYLGNALRGSSFNVVLIDEGATTDNIPNGMTIVGYKKV